MIRLRALVDRLRESLFFVPSVFLVVAVGAAWLTVWADQVYRDELAEFGFVLGTTIASARAILSTVAGATITVAGFVISVTLLSVQLSASQYSPRVVRNFLRDPFQQVVIGIVVGTFTYSLVVLAVTRIAGQNVTAHRNLSVTVGLILAVVSILALVAFIDRATKTLQPNEIVRRIADETLELVEERHHAGPAVPPAADDFTSSGEPVTVSSDARGWIQQIDTRGVMRASPPGALIRLRVRVGDFVMVGDDLVSIWSEGEVGDRHGPIREAFVIGRARSMSEDVTFGLRQLVDVAVRALSPGINDPTTANEAVHQIGAVLARILPGELPPRVVADDEDRRLYRPREYDRGDYIAAGFSEIRRAAASHPEVIATVVEQLGKLAKLLARNDLGLLVEPLRDQARLAVDGMQRAGVQEDDIAPIRSHAEDLGLVDETAPDESAGVRSHALVEGARALEPEAASSVD